MLLVRLAVPVAYNFLSLCGIYECAFFKVMGPLSKVEFLGDAINTFVYPCVLILACVLATFRVDGRIYNLLGLRQYEFDSRDGRSGALKTGRIEIINFKQIHNLELRTNELLQQEL